MNLEWKTFLLSVHTAFEADGRIDFAEKSSGRGFLYPISHLGVLSVSGKDAAKLLQGQATCNVYDVIDTQATIGAFCNPQGRAISTFLLAKKAEEYLLILPLELMETIRTRLQKYVLRSDVAFTDRSCDLCLLGLFDNKKSNEPMFAAHSENGSLFIAFGAGKSRHLLIADVEQAISLWSGRQSNQGFIPKSPQEWQLLDMQDGIPWLNTATTEDYIPQMLNLDTLGGISFTKGCYTGQEVVARTHYLGKVKRALHLAECRTDTAPESNAVILDKKNMDQSAGQVLTAISQDGICTLLAVLLVPECGEADLALKDRPEVSLRLLPFKNA